MADDDSESDWRFSVDEVGPDDPDDAPSEDGEDGEGGDSWGVTLGEDDDGPTVTVGGPERAAEELSEEGGNVAGAFAPEAAIEPGTPSLENVAFATAGAILTALVFAALLTPLDLAIAAQIGGVIALGAAVLYAAFRRY